MIEFKQILGRGTRIREDYGKMYFTLIDFRDVSRLFADKDFDGDPVKVRVAAGADDVPDENEEEDTVEPGDDEEHGDDPYETKDTGDGSDIISDPPGEGRKKYYVNDVEVRVINDRVQ